MSGVSFKISTKNLAMCLIILMFIAHARFFYLIDVSIDRRIIQSLCAIFAFFAYTPGGIRSIRPANKIVYSFLFLAIVQLIASGFIYNQSIEVVTKLFLEYGVLFSVFPIVWYALDRKKGIETIENIVIIIGALMATFLVVEGLILQPIGYSFLGIDFGVRLGGIRYINSTEPILFASALSLTMLLKRKHMIRKTIVYIYSMIICIMELLLISKTRAILIMLFITIIAVVWARGYYTKGNVTAKRTLIFIGLTAFVIWIINTSIFSEYFTDYLQTQDTQYDTVAIRSNEIAYALGLLGRNPFTTLFGTGFVSEYSSALSYQGTSLKGVRTDLGAIGFINEFGVFGAIWLIGILVYATRTLITAIRLRKDALDLVAVYMIFVLGLPTLFLFNGERMPYFPLFLSIVIFHDIASNH